MQKPKNENTQSMKLKYVCAEEAKPCIDRPTWCIHCYSCTNKQHTNSEYFSNIYYCNRKQLIFHHFLSTFMVRCSVWWNKAKTKYLRTLGMQYALHDLYRRCMAHFSPFLIQFEPLCIHSGAHTHTEEKKSFKHIHFIEFEFNIKKIIIKMANNLLECVRVSL